MTTAQTRRVPRGLRPAGPAPASSPSLPPLELQPRLEAAHRFPRRQSAWRLGPFWWRDDRMKRMHHPLFLFSSGSSLNTAGSGEQGTGGCDSVPTGWSAPRRGAGRSTLLPCPALAGPGGGKILGNSFLRQGAFLFLQATCEGGWGSGPSLLTCPPSLSVCPPAILCPVHLPHPTSLSLHPWSVHPSGPPGSTWRPPQAPTVRGCAALEAAYRLGPQPQELPSAWGPGAVGTVTKSRSEACFLLTLNVSPFAE